MYKIGRGVIPNSVIAYVLFNLAAANNHETAQKNRERVAQELSKKQLLEAQKLSTTWELGKPLPTKTTTWSKR